MPMPFVHHYAVRTDNVLPVVCAVATLPVVLPDGTLLATQGIDRDRGIVFRIPEELLARMPSRASCDDGGIKAAYKFLTDEFLVDVLADATGKAIIIAAMLTLMERVLLADRPVFFVSAGRRGGGKTTLLVMLMMAITGVRPSAAAWSPVEEERRKALFAYLLEGPVAIIWDNIPRGTQISCPHVERSCTATSIEDRVLGASERAVASATAIHLFTGNNVGPKGDLSSRALKIELEVDRSDPENRVFAHPDATAWTEANRGKILVALYTLLIGNKMLRPGSNAEAKTRFKGWYRLIGSTVENAARLAGVDIDFGELFLSQEGDDEDNASLHDALIALTTPPKGGGQGHDKKWAAVERAETTEGFFAAEVAKRINDCQSEYTQEENKEAGITLRDYLFPELVDKPVTTVSSKSVGRRLMKHCGEPVGTVVDGMQRSVTLMAKAKADPGHPTIFWVRLS
jgi:hypothetical protein